MGSIIIFMKKSIESGNQYAEIGPGADKSKELPTPEEKAERERLAREYYPKKDKNILRASNEVSKRQKASERARYLAELREKKLARKKSEKEKQVKDVVFSQPEEATMGLVTEGGKKVDLRDAVRGGRGVKIVPAERFGFDAVKNQVLVPVEMLSEPTGPARIIREVIRGAATPSTELGRKIVLEREARGKLRELEEKQQEQYSEWGDTDQMRRDYEKAERKASSLRRAAEEAIDAQLDQVLKSFKENQGVDIEGMAYADEIKKAIRSDLRKAQAELISPYDDDGNEFFTGEKPTRIDKFLNDSQPMRDIRYRLKMDRVPINPRWARYGVWAGVGVGYGAYLVGRGIAGKVRNFARNRLWNMEHRLKRIGKVGLYGAASAITEGFGSLWSGTMDLLGLKSNIKFGEGLKHTYNKAKAERIPEPPWKAEEEKKKREAEARKKEKKAA